MNQQVPKKGFFGYPSYPPTIGESIKNAVGEINDSGLVKLTTWEDLSVTGNIIIRNILDEIDNSDIFCIDLTGLNPNVMFELGYAIVKNKKIWIILDNSLSKNKETFEKLRIFTNIGYSSYTNSRQILDGFYSDFESLDERQTLFEQLIGPSIQNSDKDILFYLKSPLDTEASVQISRRISNSPIPKVIDDPQEVTNRYLPWYAEQIYSSICVVCHLINPEMEDAVLHNAKYSLVSGMALGMGKNLLMLTHGNHLSPMDYRDLLKQYATAKESSSYLEEWLIDIENNWIEQEASRDSYVATLKLAQDLQELQVGDPIAENESEKLIDYYFVETSAFHSALEGNQAVFVGRKGTGKSANFLKLANEIGRDRRNLVIKIKPVAYELQGITDFLSRFSEIDKKTYAIESLWKFLLISEIANVLRREIKNRPFSESNSNEDENALLEILEKNEAMLSGDFAVRLEKCVESLLAMPQNQQSSRSIEFDQQSISQALHSGIYTELRIILGKLLSDRKRVAVIVDNLDKAWNKNTNLENLAEFFLGLLSATKRLMLDFKRKDSRKESANISAAVFLRSDIFHKIKKVAREPDKLNSFKMKWDDSEQLLRVIEERFIALHSGNLSPNEIWSRYFCEKVNGFQVKDYFLDRILPRPRDLVYFIKASIDIAVNRKHPKVEEDDILEAEKRYSEFAIDSLLVESELSPDVLQPIIYEFIGGSSILTLEEVESVLATSNLGSDKIQNFIDDLCELRFLGIEVLENKFRFSDDPNEYSKAKILSRKLCERTPDSTVRYQINPAYHAYLELAD